MGNFIACKAKFLRDEDERLSELGIDSNDSYDLEDFIFNITNVVAVNRSDNGEWSTIWFDSHERVTVDIPYNIMEDILLDTAKLKTITSDTEINKL